MMIHKNKLEIKMIQGKMAESLLTLNDTFNWLMHLMTVADFHKKHDFVEFSNDFMKRVEEIDNYLTTICQGIDDPRRKEIEDCDRCSAEYDALRERYAKVLVEYTLYKKDKQ